jgi:hypothetical protein
MSTVLTSVKVQQTKANTYPRNKAKVVMAVARTQRPDMAVPVSEFPYSVFVCGNIPLSNGSSIKFCKTPAEATQFAIAEATTF